MEVEIVRFVTVKHGNGTIKRWMSAVEFREMLLHLTPNVLTEITIQREPDPGLSKPYPRSKRKGPKCAHPRT